MSKIGENTFGKNLKSLRISRGFMQSDVARRADNLSQSTITQLENGHKDPTLQTIIRLAKALEVPPSRLVDLDNWTTINTAEFEKARSIEDVDANTLKNAMTLIKHLRRLGLLS